jgi:hypothetical protein
MESLSLSSALEGVSVNATPQPLYPWQSDGSPIVHEAGWAPEPMWTGAENLATTGIRFPDRPATDRATAAHVKNKYGYFRITMDLKTGFFNL